ncbi:hypothetical protein G4B88_007121 [Cannabis sativa]|uniref:Eukaryotic translation initiation factor 3 subunit J n=1 Tax=Cannabis sativa TaxID=3483 RepID=A0A7J6GNI4_CANSA|nr:hypothetical protein G4B88_007121 [Cannabis sativa]
MEDWEDEHIPPVITTEPLSSKWADEDVDENDVKDSWEDDDESQPATEPARNPPADKAPKKSSVKAADKKVKAVESKEEPLDPVAEKLRQQRLVEEADYKSTKELFAKKGEDKTLDNFIPKSESDFQEYAELISHKLLPFEVISELTNITFMRLATTSLKAADAKDVASSITAIANEKLKLEKEANAGKKKTGAKKKQLLVDKPDDDLVATRYDDMDDYDFM